jgi:hypothetical protein
MSANPGTKLRELSDQQLQEIAGGGDCTVGEVEKAIQNLQQSYDTLVDFASYVIGRVAGAE